MFLRKYSTSGAIEWTRQIGTDLYDGGEGIGISNDGKIYVAGDTYGAIDGNTNSGSIDSFIVKFDTNGNQEN